MNPPSIVLTPFVGAYDPFGIGYSGGSVEALLKHVSNHDMVSADRTMNIAQQTLPLFDGDVALQDPSVASLVEFVLHKNK